MATRKEKLRTTVSLDDVLRAAMQVDPTGMPLTTGKKKPAPKKRKATKAKPKK